MQRRTDGRLQSSRLAEFGGPGMSFNICCSTLGSLAMLAAIRRAALSLTGVKRTWRGHPNRSLMTQSVILQPSFAALRKVHSSTSSARLGLCPNLPIALS